MNKFVLALVAMFGGCTTNYNNSFVTHYYYDDDSAVVEDPTPVGDDDSSPPGDDDSSATPVPAAQAFVYWEGFDDVPSIDLTQQPPGGTLFQAGRWGITVFGEPGTVVTVEAATFTGLVASEPWDDGYVVAEHEGVSVGDAVGTCEVYDGYTGVPVWAARAPVGGSMVFGEGKPFSIPIGQDGEGWGLLSLQCHALEAHGMEMGEQASVAFSVLDGENIAIHDAQGEPVEVGLLSDNLAPQVVGNSWRFPKSAAFVFVSEVVPTPYLEVSLNVATPVGAAVPGENGLFMFNVTARQGSVTLNSVVLSVSSTDNAATSWNSCTLLGERFHLFQTSDMTTELGAVVTSAVAGPCADATNALAPVVSASNGWFTFSIGEDDTVAFVLMADVGGASSALDDTIQVSLESVVALDTLGNVVPITAPFLPINGGTLVF